MVENLKPGDIVFAYELEISIKTGKFLKILKPTELIVIKKVSTFFVELSDHNRYHITHIFSTYLEAKDSWNLELNKVLNILQQDYEKRVQNIKRKLL